LETHNEQAVVVHVKQFAPKASEEQGLQTAGVTVESKKKAGAHVKQEVDVHVKQLAAILVQSLHVPVTSG
jgi:hypothetical protein